MSVVHKVLRAASDLGWRESASLGGGWRLKRKGPVDLFQSERVRQDAGRRCPAYQPGGTLL